MDLHSKGSQFQWISGKNPPDLLGFWQWFSPPNGSWRQETIGDYATQKKSSEIYKFWKNSGDFWKILNYFWCFQDIKWNYTQKAVNFQFFLIPGSDFRLPGVRFFNGITLRSAFFSKSHKFFKNLMTSDDKWWWVMMSDDEWWWVMRSDDEG